MLSLHNQEQFPGLLAEASQAWAVQLRVLRKLKQEECAKQRNLHS